MSRKNRTKCVALILVLTLLFGNSRNMSLFAADQNLNWFYDENTKTLTISGNGEMDYQSTYPWNSYRNEAETLVIEPGITNIYRDVFSSYTGLKQVTLAESVSTIDNRAFYGCSSLSEVTAPGVKEIGYSVFEGCAGLERVTMPQLETIGTRAFKGCRALTDQNGLFILNGILCLAEGSKLGENLILPAEVTQIAGGAAELCTELKSVQAPGVTEVGSYAFYGCRNLVSVEMDSLQEIGAWAFEDCGKLADAQGLTVINHILCKADKDKVKGNLMLPDDIIRVSSYAFYQCETLETIQMPNVEKISSDAFYECSALTEVSIPNITEFLEDTFYRCTNLYMIDAPNAASVVYEGIYNAEDYSYDNLYSDEEGRIMIGSVLYDVEAEKVKEMFSVKEGTVAVGNKAYSGLGETEITGIKLPASFTNETEIQRLVENLSQMKGGLDTVSEIEIAKENPVIASKDGMLFNKEITRFICCPQKKQGTCTIPDTVDTIGCGAISGCTYLTKIVIPESVKTIEKEGLCIYPNEEEDLYNSGEFYFEGNVPSGEGIEQMFYQKSLSRCSRNMSVYYKYAASGWKELSAEYPLVSFQCIDAPLDTSEGEGNTQNAVIPGGTTDLGNTANSTVTVSGISTVPIGRKAKVSLNKKKLMLKKGIGKTLLARVTSDDGRVYGIKWSSSNPKVASVDTGGTIIAKKCGRTVIKATLAENKKIYAKCQVTVPYQITYKLNKGKNNSKNPSGYYNEKVTLKAPARSGYKFKGWYTDKIFKHKITVIKKGTKKDYTLYAKWEKK